MKKAEWQTVCAEQEALLNELRALLELKLGALDGARLTVRTQDDELNALRAENARLRSELEEADSTWRAEFKNLSAGYQSSLATLNKYWSENFNALEASLRQCVETELSNMAERLRQEDPGEYERMLTDWLMEFLADLENALQRPPA